MIKITLTVVIYFIIVFVLAFSFISCKSTDRVHKHAPNCFTYSKSSKPKTAKEMSKYHGHSPKFKKHNN